MHKLLRLAILWTVQGCSAKKPTLKRIRLSKWNNNSVTNISFERNTVRFKFFLTEIKIRFKCCVSEIALSFFQENVWRRAGIFIFRGKSCCTEEEITSKIKIIWRCLGNADIWISSKLKYNNIRKLYGWLISARILLISLFWEFENDISKKAKLYW